jgi:hypothetical protein
MVEVKVGRDLADLHAWRHGPPIQTQEARAHSDSETGACAPTRLGFRSFCAGASHVPFPSYCSFRLLPSCSVLRRRLWGE